MRKLIVRLKERSYNIFIDKGLINNVGDYVSQISSCKRICIITDDNLNVLYGEKIKNHIEEKGYTVNIISIKPGEKSKSFENLLPIYNSLVNFNITRSDLIIAFGGGVVGDIAGFVAATFLRGIKFIQIPTSLLAQVDSSIGGKVGVDLESGKNLVGSFYHPHCVLIDVDILRTLPEKYFTDGMGEIIKYGCIRDKTLFKDLEKYNKVELKDNIENIIFRCCDIKRSIVERDERDIGERMLLNFGHTIGHSIEKAYKYEGYTHGEAVAIGMNMITKISESKGLTNEGVSNRLKNILNKYNLPYNVHELNKEKLLQGIMVDKKNINDNLNLVIIKEFGKGYIYPTTIEFFKEK